MMKKVIIAGAGGIGRACALMLLEKYGEKIEIFLADIDRTQMEAAKNWIYKGLDQRNAEIHHLDLSQVNIDSWTPDTDLLLDCTPGRFATQMAKAAYRSQAHYANLTEWVAATEEIIQLAKESTSAFALQTGLAPGFVNLYALKLIEHFTIKYPDAKPQTVKMRVGALSRYASSPSFYAFTWSPEGVSAEYLNDSEVIHDYKCTKKPALSDREQLMIDGELFEADLTSGGAANLPHFLENKIQNLDYKSLRYPGHFDWAQQLIRDTPQINPSRLTSRFMEKTPFHEEDRIIIYVSVNGTDDEKSIELVRHREVLPLRKNQVFLSAIQRTTAASLAQTAELLLSDQFSGPLLQSDYPIDEFLNGSFIRDHYGDISIDFKI